MNLEKIGIAFSASLLAISLNGGIAFGASTDPSQGMGGSNIGVSTDSPPELNSAQQRVEMSRGKLDQARQQLSAAKAMLKAAEAEHKAARADQEALSLRTQARKLADASGLQESVSTGQRLYPANFPQQGGAPGAGSPSANLSATGMQVPGSAPVTPVSVDTPDYTGQGVAPVSAGSLGAPLPNQ